MRNALVILSLGGVLFGTSVAHAIPLDVGACPETKVTEIADKSASSPVTTVSLSTISRGKVLEIDQELLPVRGSDLPLSSSNAPGSPAGLQASVVEAIPTPSAFHAGGLLLVAVFAARYFRKLRIS